MSKYDDLLKDYRQLAKKADQRLVRLEKLSGQEHYNAVLKYAYARAQKDIASWSGEGATRFNTKPPANIQQLQAKINDIKQFIDMPTSSKSGITQVYKNRANTVNDLYGTNFKWQDLANYYESDLYRKLDKEYGSKTQLQVLNTLKKVNKKPDEIKRWLESNKKLSDDEIADEIVKNLLKQGITFNDLYT